MLEICKFLEVASQQEADNLDGGFIVEQCSKHDPEIDLCIICQYAQIDNVKGWIKENCKKIADYACSQIDDGQGELAMKLVASTMKIPSYTREFVSNYGGVQEFLDYYHRTKNLNLGMEDEAIPEEIEEPVVDFAASAEEEVIPDFFGGDEEPIEDVAVEESAVEERPVAVDIPESVVSAVPAETVEQPVSNSISVTIPPSLAGGEAVKVPFNSLVDFANYINEAANKLETSEFAESYILQEDGIPYAIEYVDKFSPTMLKEFIKHYVQSAESDTDYIRITKLLDSLVRFSESYSKDGGLNE